MVRIQNSLFFIRAIKGPGDQECFTADTALCLGQKRQARQQMQMINIRRGSRDQAKAAGAWLWEEDDPPTHLHSSTILQQACQSQVQLASAGCAFRNQVQVWHLATMLLAPQQKTPPGSQMSIYLSYNDAASVQAMNKPTAGLKRCVANMKDPKRQNQRSHFTAENAEAQEPVSKGHRGS